MSLSIRYYIKKIHQLKWVERSGPPSDERAGWLAKIEELNREWFVKCEDILHRDAIGPTWMRDERVADKVAENLHRLDGREFRLDAFSVMSNHVHTRL
jgi:hypothetical protein